MISTDFRAAEARTIMQGGRSTKYSDVEAILHPPSLSYFEKIGDWLVLYFICKNLDVLVINDLIRHLHKSETAKNSNPEMLKLKPESSEV